MRELFVDNFAGGGGASSGIEVAIGRSVDIAINHDPDAIAMHKANHPTTKHYCEDVWEVDPVVACGGNPVALAWFSPDCKHFSRAKGGKPVDKNIRGLAWVEVKWALLVRPRVMMTENVPEIQTWGPLGADNKPIKERSGETFKGFISILTTGLSKEHPAYHINVIPSFLAQYFQQLHTSYFIPPTLYLILPTLKPPHSQTMSELICRLALQFQPNIGGTTVPPPFSRRRTRCGGSDVRCISRSSRARPCQRRKPKPTGWNGTTSSSASTPTPTSRGG